LNRSGDVRYAEPPTTTSKGGISAGPGAEGARKYVSVRTLDLMMRPVSKEKVEFLAEDGPPVTRRFFIAGNFGEVTSGMDDPSTRITSRIGVVSEIRP
jgi:hypothetical protein